MRWLAPAAALALSAQGPIPPKDFGDFCVATAYELCGGDECVAPTEKRDLTITLEKAGRNAHVCEGGTCMEAAWWTSPALNPPREGNARSSASNTSRTS